MNAFLPADILMPQTDSMEKWAVIACDQFTSDQAYWDRVRKNAEGAVSTINLILPEAELGTEKEAEHTRVINETMARYMKDHVFTTYQNSLVYVERTLTCKPVTEVTETMLSRLERAIYMFTVLPPSTVSPPAGSVYTTVPAATLSSSTYLLTT